MMRSISYTNDTCAKVLDLYSLIFFFERNTVGEAPIGIFIFKITRTQIRVRVDLNMVAVLYILSLYSLN